MTHCAISLVIVVLVPGELPLYSCDKSESEMKCDDSGSLHEQDGARYPYGAPPDLRDFVESSRHPDPRRAWKGGPELWLLTTDPADPADPGMSSKS